MRGLLPLTDLCVLLVFLVLCLMPVAAAYSGPCPIGTGGAPELRNAGLSSSALCRGACGIDCPSHRCEAQPDYIRVINQGTKDQGICTYTDVVACDSHQGCRDHDSCYDGCVASRGETSLLGPCHRACNDDCFNTFGYTNCALWADMPGSVIDSLGTVVDYTAGPEFDSIMYFSDEPTFTPRPATPTVTPTPTGEDDEETDEGDDSPFSDILKDKPKIQNSAADWIKDGERALRTGDYELAIDCFNAAEGIIASGYKDKESRPAAVDEALADVEEHKVSVYANWPGHEAERQEARQNVKDLTQSAETKKKLEAWDLPGFEVWAALLTVMLLFLFRRIKP